MDGFSPTFAFWTNILRQEDNFTIIFRQPKILGGAIALPSLHATTPLSQFGIGKKSASYQCWLNCGGCSLQDMLG